MAIIINGIKAAGRGTAGKDGQDGKTPYTVAREAGYLGTEAEFNALLAALGAHAFRHTAGGDDEITPAMIGAAPAYTYGTEDLEAGVSTLAEGTLYFVYE